MMEKAEQIQYDIIVRVAAFSSLDAGQLRQMLVVALWNEADESVIADGTSPELEVIEYVGISIEEAI